MKKIYKIFILSIVVFSVFLSCGFATQAETAAPNEAYCFPLTPDTDAEAWAELQSHTAKVAACQIPENLLATMSTEALLETVKNYPLSVDFYAYNTLEMGYSALKSQFNGIEELERRYTSSEDAMRQIDNVAICAQTSALSQQAQAFEDFFIEDVVQELQKQNGSAAEDESADLLIQPFATADVVKTPRGSNVPVVKDCTWATHNQTRLRVSQLDKQAAKTYPRAVKIQEISPKYNCHSYAWYSTASTNRYWMDNPSPYIADGSYYSTGNSRWYAGGKIVWSNSTEGIVHSGIIMTVSEHRLDNIRSKWGLMGTYEHLVSDCPYSGAITGYFPA